MKREAATNTKMGRLERRLEIEHWGAAGILELLWHLTAREAPCGNIGKLPDEDIAYGIGWFKGDAHRLIDALVESGWIDRSDRYRLVIHDWSEHADDAVNHRLARGGLLFCDGEKPRMCRLPKEERERIEAVYKRTASARQAHDEHTASARQAVALPEPEPYQNQNLTKPEEEPLFELSIDKPPFDALDPLPRKNGFHPRVMHAYSQPVKIAVDEDDNDQTWAQWFQVWWDEVCWKRHARAKAEAAFQSAVRKYAIDRNVYLQVAFDDIMRLSIGFVTRFKGTSDWQFKGKMLPTTFFNQERWDDGSLSQNGSSHAK